MSDQVMGRQTTSSPQELADKLKEMMLGHVADRLVLLGAGASIEAGLPDGKALARTFASNSSLPMLKKILDRVQNSGYADIERAFSVLESIAELNDPDSLLSDLRRNDLLRAPLQEDPIAARRELDVVAGELRRLLWIVDGLGPGVVSAALGQAYEPPDSARYLTPLVTASLGGTIASLNYDNVIEQAGGMRVLTSVHGKKRIIVPDEQADRVRLLKLHGSLDWRRVGDDVIRGGRPREREQYDPAIVFGAVNKLRHYGPFLDLLRAFVNKLGAVHYLFVIGYGFRDKHINEVLRIWATEPAPDGQVKSMVVCQGPGVDRLPALVQPWSVADHINIKLWSEPASVAAGLFA